MSSTTTSKYEFGDFSFIENNREYYDHTIFLNLIDSYSLWDFVKNFSSIYKHSDEYKNKYMIFEDHYNNIGYGISESTYDEIMYNFEEICELGWDTFIDENVEYE